MIGLSARLWIVTVLAVLGVAVSVGAVSAEGTAVTSPPHSKTYISPGDYKFTVPAGVGELTITALGARGGNCFGGEGGEGARVGAQVAVSPGERLIVQVAGDGSDCPGSSDPPPAGGFGGGAPAGAGGLGAGASGGGASLVAPGTSSPEVRRALVVAGGGGGGDDGSNAIQGGNAGAPGGAGDVAHSGGGAGTARGPGTGGAAGDSNATAGHSGSLGKGGKGGAGDTTGFSVGGGGGGGGYYGGGGGGGGAVMGNPGAGGGGSSHIAKGAKIISAPAPTASSAEVTITYTVVAAPQVKLQKATINAKAKTARFEFKALGKPSGFQCALVKHGGKAVFSECHSPKFYRHLKTGKYTFEVRAAVGGLYGKAASRAFRLR